MNENDIAIKESPILEFKNSNKWLSLAIDILILILVFYSLRESLHFLYADDDLVLSLIKGTYFFHGITVRSVLEYLLTDFASQVHAGRIMFGSYIVLFPILLFNLVQYRIFILLLICSNVWLLGKCIFQWTGSYRIKWVAMVISPLFFQMHFYFHHPILSYYGMMQFQVLVMLASMVFFWNYLEDQKAKWLILSGLLYLYGLTIYEVEFVLLPVFPVLAYLKTRNIKKTFRYSILPLALCLTLMVVNLVNKLVIQNSANSYSGSSFNFDIVKIGLTTLNNYLRQFLYQPSLR